jgi:hypothetical protein
MGLTCLAVATAREMLATIEMINDASWKAPAPQ